MATFKHPSLNATLHGLVRGPVSEFRGIKYARIPARFELPEPIDDWQGQELDCKAYGPKCPQVYTDVGHLLRIPEDIKLPEEEEDEFGCVNLDVTGPPVSEVTKEKLPVMIWIHGGSQVMTFASAASGICDTSKIVEDSIKLGKPIIIASVQYRLNIFAFGDEKSPKNLALRDQRVAVEWVRKHIAGFGGDPENITLAGESAGAVYVHGHVVKDAPVKRAIFQSGSLDLSPPRPLSAGKTVFGLLEEKLPGSSLRIAPAEDLIQALVETNITSLWLQQNPEDPELGDWASRTGEIEALLIGDVEYESIIWRNGIETLPAQTIVDAFNLAGKHSGELRRLYGISAERATASKTGALDFIGDVRFSWPIRKLSAAWRAAGRQVYGYVLDQANPWQASSRAHHAVDLLLLFGGLDLPSAARAADVGGEMRRRWIAFVNGDAPWSASKTFAFGPFGECRELDAGGLAARRRAAHMDVLERVEPGKIAAVFAALAAGRVSLLN